MKKKLLTVLLIGMMVFALTACDEALGKWRITEITAGDLTMTEQDIKDMGIDPGYIKLNKSGSAELSFLDEEYEGKWETAGDGTITLTYGDGKVGTATITDGVMDAKDAEGSTYTLKK